jgi:tetratricopeptide (TPR) repeat protein
MLIRTGLLIALAVFTMNLELSYSADRPEVRGTMQRVFNSLMNLQPFLVNNDRFSDPKNRAIIEKDLKELSAIKHAFPKKMKDEEPGAAAISSLFGDYLKDVRSRYKHGDYEYARNRTKTVTGFCFGCHSRITTSQNFVDLSKRVENLGLQPDEKAQFYAATRQFDRALKIYKEILASQPSDEMGMIRFIRGLRHALRVTVQVRRDPKETYELLEGISKRKDLPEFAQRFVSQWKKDAKAWLDEKEEEKLTGETLITKAEKLIERAASLQAFPADENGDISFLRATNYLHEALDSDPKSPHRGKALYLLGAAYYALQEPALWDLDRLYFEACVRENPKTDISKKCYQRYSDKIYLGYTGSAGTFIPEDEVKKLMELRKISE